MRRNKIVIDRNTRTLPRVDRERAFTELRLLERDRELRKLMQSGFEGKPILVCGSPGLGKTRLLLEVRHNLMADGRKVLYVPFVQPLHEFLVSLAARLLLDLSQTRASP
ncbi:MAG: hypothetical protein WAM39_05785 [Bryobacteraceae bacterium]